MKHKIKFYKLKILDAPTRKLPHDRGTVFGCVDPAVGSSNVDVHVNVIKAGASRGEIHYHEKAENVYIVMDGQLEVCIEGGDNKYCSIAAASILAKVERDKYIEE